MFTKHFNLSEQPFGTTPDPRFLFLSESHREALASLYCAFYANRGFAALIAEPGMGKTTLLFEFLERVRDCAKTVFLFNTFCGPDDIVAYILRDSGIDPGPTVSDRYHQINDMLSAEAKIGRPVVLVVDEAQNLSPHALEGIRMLTNFETARTKLIQVILAGQPQLAHTLAGPGLAQFRQRISTLCRIKTFTPAETRSYVKHRLQFSGYSGDELFTPAAFDLVAEASSGIPRVINTLCFNALCICRARMALQVNDSMVREAIEDLQLPECPPQCFAMQQANEPLIAERAPSPERHPSSRVMRTIYVAALLIGIFGALSGFRTLNARLGKRLDSTAESAVSGALERMAPQNQERNLQRAPSSSEPRRGGQLSSTVLLDPADRSPNGAKKPLKVQVVAGDTLTGITTAHLGTFNWNVLRKIQELNPELTDPNHIETGSTIRLPGIRPNSSQHIR